MSKQLAHVRHPRFKQSQPAASFVFSADRLGWIVLAATAAGMLFWTWGKWLDVQIDFGRELYIPWQLTEGKVLYRDLAYFNGPVSPYLNALWFTLFGVSLRTLVFCNLGLTVITSVFLYRILRAIAGAWTAFLGTELFFVLFAFGHTLAGGNYNFICPYSHEMTHGLLFALAGVWGVFRYSEKGGWRWIIFCSVLAGLVFLTKVEVALAGIFAIGSGLFAASGNRTNFSLRKIGIVAGMFAMIFLSVVFAAWGLLALAMSPGEAFRGVAGSWRHLGNESLAGLSFYRQFLGTLEWRNNLWLLVKWTGLYALLTFIPVGMALRIRFDHFWLRMAAASILFLLGILLAGFCGRNASWLDAFRPLPLVVLTASVFYAIHRFWNRRQTESNPSHPLTISFLILSFLLLLKMILRARIHHYGFGLGLPAVLTGLVCLEWIAGWIARKGGSAAVFRGGYLASLVVLVFSYLQMRNVRMERKTVLVSSGTDGFYADARGLFYNQLLEQIRHRIPPEGTLAVLPEGIMVNYLTRRVNSTPYYSVIPPEMLMFGESRILNDFSAHPPDCIAIVPRNCREFGVEPFGTGYGQDLWSWIQKRYQEHSRIRPTEDPSMHFVLMKRKSD